MADRFVPVDLAQVDVRADDPSALPFDAPDANRATAWFDRDVLWLGPDEWLVVGASGTEGTIASELDDLVTGHRSIVDVSAARVAFDLDGALEVLATGCPIDLDPTRWRPGMCAQTVFGLAQVLLQQRDDRTTRVFVRPSFASYVTARLDAAVS